MSDLNQIVPDQTLVSAETRDGTSAIAGQAASAGLGVALAASIAGIAVAPAALVGLGISALFYGAKRFADDRNGLPQGER